MHVHVSCDAVKLKIEGRRSLSPGQSFHPRRRRRARGGIALVLFEPCCFSPQAQLSNIFRHTRT